MDAEPPAMLSARLLVWKMWPVEYGRTSIPFLTHTGTSERCCVVGNEPAVWRTPV